VNIKKNVYFDFYHNTLVHLYKTVLCVQKGCSLWLIITNNVKNFLNSLLCYCCFCSKQLCWGYQKFWSLGIKNSDFLIVSSSTFRGTPIWYWLLLMVVFFHWIVLSDLMGVKIKQESVDLTHLRHARLLNYFLLCLVLANITSLAWPSLFSEHPYCLALNTNKDHLKVLYL